MPPRPLSPHLGVYKFMYTMTLSILHRFTGIAASVGFLVFAWWLMALASGHEAYQRFMSLATTPVAKLLLVGFAFSFIYHFCNGIRHLVWDTGRGIPSSELTRIFEAFHQVDSGTHREHGGVGLGLALVKRLSELLGAKVQVQSELGHGTTFTVRLPVASALTIPQRRASLVAELA